MRRFNTVQEAHAAGVLKRGVKVRTNGDGKKACPSETEGVISLEGDKLYVWQDKRDGSAGLDKVGDHKYSWQVDLDNSVAWIEVEPRTPTERTFMAKLELEEKDLRVAITPDGYMRVYLQSPEPPAKPKQ